MGIATKRETKSARIEIRVWPSLKEKAEAVALSKNQTLSDFTHDLLTHAVERYEKKKGLTIYTPPGNA